MNQNEDIVFDFEGKSAAIIRKPRIKNLVSALSLMYVAGSITIFILSYHIGNIPWTALISSKTVFIATVVKQFLPIVALLLFTANRKIGWYLVLMVFTIEVLFKFSLIQSQLENWKSLTYAFYLLVGINLIALLFSVVIVILLFQRSLQSFYKIRPLEKIITMVSACIIFLLLRYYILGFLLHLRKDF